jgi:hypothetical protein
MSGLIVTPDKPFNGASMSCAVGHAVPEDGVVGSSVCPRNLKLM